MPTPHAFARAPQKKHSEMAPLKGCSLPNDEPELVDWDSHLSSEGRALRPAQLPGAFSF